MLRCLLALACLIPAALHAENKPAPKVDPASPLNLSLAAALADCQKLPIDQQQHCRYFTLYAIPEKEREQFCKVFAYHVNCLSRNAELVAPVRVGPDLLRVDIREYSWDRKVYETLAQLDPYFHLKINVQPAQLVPVAQIAAVAPAAVFVVGKDAEARDAVTLYSDRELTQIRGPAAAGTKFPVKAIEGEALHLRTGVGDLWGRASDFNPPAAPVPVPTPAPAAPAVPAFAIPVEIRPGVVSAAAPWLDKDAISSLITLTQSQAPLLRADWFFAQTCRQVNFRQKETGAGYYDFLGIKEEKDIEQLAGLDRKKAEELQRQIGAIVRDSGVALNNRQIFRFSAITGGYWETHDAEQSDDTGSAVRLLDPKDFKFQAKEVFFCLPNRLFGFAAVAAADGKLQATVPDKIASDDRTTSRDHKIHSSLSCIRCHTSGLLAIDDYARQFYADPPGDTKLQSGDYEQLKRLRQIYLVPLEDDFDADQLVYARTLKRLTGYKPAELARAFAYQWQRYADTSVSGTQLALELGVEPDEMRQRFVSYAKAFGSIDPVLAGFLKRPEYKARREYIEEAYVLAQAGILGIQFADAAGLASPAAKSRINGPASVR